MTNKVQLTDARVRDLKCPQGKVQAFLWDAQERGLGVRALPDYVRDGVKRPGAKTWVLQGRIAGGKERRLVLGRVDTVPLNPRIPKDDEQDEHPEWHSARRLARDARRLMTLGHDPQATATAAKATKVAREVSLRSVADHYIATKKTRNGPLKANTVRDINKHVSRSFAAWQQKPIASITRDMCATRHAELAEGGLTGERPAPSQAAQAFVVLRALINWAMKKYRVNGKRLFDENPVDVLQGQTAPSKARTTKVPMDRIGHVWEALRKVRGDLSHMPSTHTQADALAFMLTTGARSEEALALTWDRVELGEVAGSWHLPTPKNSNAVTLPLNAAARAVVASRKPRKGCPYVFPARAGKGHASAPRGPAMEAVSAAAGCQQDRHALRRTFTTLAVTVLGIELWKAQLLTNHLSTGGNVTLDHYVERNDLRYLAPEVERIGTYIVEQAAIVAAGNVVKLPGKRRA